MAALGSSEPRQPGAQFLHQSFSLAWRVPPPSAAPLATLPPALAKLRSDALATGATGATWVKYIAALSVAEHQHTLPVTSELAHALHALAHVYDTKNATLTDPGQKLGVALASLRAVQLASHYYQHSVPWPPSLAHVLQVQCDVLHWAAVPAAPASNLAMTLAHLYEEELGKDGDAYLRMGEAHWRASALIATAPPALTAEETVSWQPTAIKSQYALRERHYAAAVATLEECERRLKGTPPEWIMLLQCNLSIIRLILLKGQDTQRLFTKHVDQVRRESTQVANTHGAYANSIGDYSDTQVLTVPLALTVEKLAPTHGIAAVDRYALDETIQREADAWAATSAAQSLSSTEAPVAAPVRVMSDIMSRLLGVPAAALLTDKSLRSATSWRMALLGALTTRLHMLEGTDALGGLQHGRQSNVALVKEALQGLLQS